MSKIYLFNYNNYFNRIIKKESTIANYGTPIYSLESTNFNYADGVETYHDINYTNQDGDYLIVTDEIESVETIISRWFVTENKRLRGGQHRLQLRRDLIADYYDIVITAPMIINRAMVKSKSNPLLFNSEGFSFNQIKKNEFLLKDESEVAWYVLYFKKNIESLTGTFNTDDVSYDKKISSEISSSIYSTGIKYYVPTSTITVTYRINTDNLAAFYFTDQYNLNITKEGLDFVYTSQSIATGILWFSQNSIRCSTELREVFENSYNSINSNLLTDLGYASSLTQENYNDLIASNGKYILDSTNNLYKIEIFESSTNLTGTITSGTTYTNLTNRVDSTDLLRIGNYGNDAFSYNVELRTINVTATLISNNSISWTIDWSTKQETIDSDFNIVAIPFDNVTAVASPSFNVRSDITQLLVNSIAKESSTNLVDIQIFPYCPIPGALQTSFKNKVMLINLDSKNYFKETNDTFFILYVQYSNFTFNIYKSISVPSFTNNEVKNYKISNECDLYKIVSPNYNGSFEFSVAKNDGVNYFNIDATLIPYKPYIHINPNFKSLYGSDFNDSKGLICGGDFSLPRYTDAWETYQLNNKNYQQIFDRQVRNLDFTQGQERVKAAFGLTVGALTGGIGGGVAGGKLGGPVGAGIGASIGSVASGIGGAIDYSMLTQAQAENKSLLLNNFSYQLGNIKALPDTINKVTPLTYNNKKFPFIEYYSATDEEKTILNNTLTYKSMTINAIGTIADYIQSDQTFISGSIIRLEDLNLNSHEANEIYIEIMKGVYI